jgi:OmpA-OmpF porin, OOP family
LLFHLQEANAVPSSYLATIAEAIPSNVLHSIATQFGAPQSTILEGIQTSVAAVMSGLSQKASDPTFLSQLMQRVSGAQDTGLASALANGALANPASPFLTTTRQFLSTVFGDKLGSLNQAIAGSTGIGSAGATTLLAVGTHAVLSFIGNKTRDGSVVAGTLPAFLANESNAMSAMLPAGFRTGAVHTHKVEVNPVVAQSVVEEKTSRSPLLWILPLLLALLGLGWWWYHSQQPAPVATTTPEPAVQPATTPVTSSTGVDLGPLRDVALPDGTTVRVPQLGVEGKLLAFIQDPNKTPDKTSWFDFDRLLFATGSTTLEPQSKDQLASVAAILKAYPAVHLTIGGYTDNTGDAASNLKLSQGRADSVVAQLGSMGIDTSRLTPKGYGEEHPVGDNSTAEGRAQNRRISMLVTAK